MIVKNCPSCIISPSCCAKYHIDNGHAKDCQDIENCVIKQVIEKCNQAPILDADWVLKLFDIEEINK